MIYYFMNLFDYYFCVFTDAQGKFCPNLRFRSKKQENCCRNLSKNQKMRIKIIKNYLLFGKQSENSASPQNTQIIKITYKLSHCL